MQPTPALADRLALDVQSAQALRAGARAGDEGALRKAAKEFEAMVVNIMLKTMRETKFNDGADDPFGGQTVRLYQEMLDQQWARKMADAKGFGFADMMVERLKAQQMASAEPDPSRTAYPLKGEAAAPMPLNRGQPAPMLPLPAGDAGALPLQRPGSGAAPAAPGQAGDARQAFLERLRPHAEAASRTTGVPTDYILAHAALESGWGRREIARADGSPSHNLFGIKAGAGWPGEAAEVTTTEYQYGLPVKRVERFRAYADYTEAFADYARLIRDRYANALDGDARRFAHGLQEGGYATDPRYGAKLYQVIQGLA